MCLYIEDHVKIFHRRWYVYQRGTWGIADKQNRADEGKKQRDNAEVWSMQISYQLCFSAILLVSTKLNVTLLYLNKTHIISSGKTLVK